MKGTDMNKGFQNRQVNGLPDSILIQIQKKKTHLHIQTRTHGHTSTYAHVSMHGFCQ